MKNDFSIILISLFISSCCNNYGDENYPIDKNYKGISFIVQSKDSNNNYKNIRIKTVEWIGINYIQEINYDTTFHLSLNVKSNQTQFKIIHELGTDTLSFVHIWNQVEYHTSCTRRSEFKRDYNTLEYSATTKSITTIPYYYVLRVN
jgi:hypothetical protein